MAEGRRQMGRRDAAEFMGGREPGVLLVPRATPGYSRGTTPWLALAVRGECGTCNLSSLPCQHLCQIDRWTGCEGW